MILLHETDDRNVLAAAADLSTRSAKERLRASLSVITCPSGRVVVTHRAKDGQLGLPCGKHDAGEDSLETAYRELEEETGIGKGSLLNGLTFVQDINFEGCVISVFFGETEKEIPVGPSKGFEVEGPAAWMTPKEIISTPSRFQNFNIVSLFNTGVL